MDALWRANPESRGSLKAMNYRRFIEKSMCFLLPAWLTILMPAPSNNQDE
jgi:hypothetical protein